MRYEGAYLDISASISRQQEDKPAPTHQPVRKDHNRGGRSRWMRHYPVIAPSRSGKPSANPIATANLECRAIPTRQSSRLRPEPLFGIHRRDAKWKSPPTEIEGLADHARSHPSHRLWAPAQARPRARYQNNMHIQNRRSEPDLSTSLRIGHFYFAPTNARKVLRPVIHKLLRLLDLVGDTGHRNSSSLQNRSSFEATKPQRMRAVATFMWYSPGT